MSNSILYSIMELVHKTYKEGGNPKYIILNNENLCDLKNDRRFFNYIECDYLNNRYFLDSLEIVVYPEVKDIIVTDKLPRRD